MSVSVQFTGNTDLFLNWLVSRLSVGHGFTGLTDLFVGSLTFCSFYASYLPRACLPAVLMAGKFWPISVANASTLLAWSELRSWALVVVSLG